MAKEDFWIPGTSFFFERDAVATIPQPLLKIGTITNTSPQISTEKITLEDPESGIPRIVDQSTNSIDERYDLTTANLNDANLALAHLADPPTAFSQALEGKGATSHYAHNGQAVSLKDAAGAYLYGVTNVAAVFKTAIDGTAAIEPTGQSFNTGTDEIKITGNHAASITVGKKFVVAGGGAVPTTLIGIYTVVSSSHAAGVTTVVVDNVVANLSNAGANALVVWGAAANLLTKETDWDDMDLGVGMITMKGAIGGSSPLAAAGENIFPVFVVEVITGDRLIEPQSINGDITGTGYLFINRNGNEMTTAREFRCSISPTSFNTPRDNYGNLTLAVSVLADVSKTNPAGRLLQIVGDVVEGN